MTSPLAVGAAVVEVAVPVGTPMSGYAARTGGALGTHDPCTVRALAVEETYWVTADVCGVDAATCAEVDQRLGGASLGAVTATHTHSGPACTPGRLGGDDATVRGRVVDAAVAAVEEARAERQAATLSAASARGVGVAVNRRDLRSPVDPPVDLVRFEGLGGDVVAWLVTYPCHPVVLSADNRLISGDYVTTLRDELERHAPGAVALFLPGAAGNLNTGHPAEASFTAAAQEGRTFADAARIGRRIAGAALGAESTRIEGRSSAALARDVVRLELQPLGETLGEPLAEPLGEQLSYDAVVTVARWRGLTIVGLPGEPFLSCAEDVRARMRGPGPVLVTGYTNDCPGYLPEAAAYDHGGYEVTDAHRYYGQPAPFARGSAERLQDAAVELASRP